jgi:hypothetical protein
MSAHLFAFVSFVHCNLLAFEAFDYNGKLPALNTNNSNSFGFAE